MLFILIQQAVVDCSPRAGYNHYIIH